MADLSIDFIGRQLQNIQAELREMKFAAEVDRRNSRSGFDSLVAEVGVKLATFEARLDHFIEATGQRLDERLGAVEQRFDNRLDMLGQQLDRIEQLLAAKGSS